MCDKLTRYYFNWMSTYKNDADRRLELLKRCKEEMEISVRDFDESINPWLEAAGYHPVTLTPKAMKKLIGELAEELGDD